MYVYRPAKVASTPALIVAVHGESYPYFAPPLQYESDSFAGLQSAERQQQFIMGRLNLRSFPKPMDTLSSTLPL